MDRILNLQREERLRLQAEAVRDREKAPAEGQNGRAMTRDDQSIRSEASTSQTSTAVGSDAGPPSKTRSLLDKLKRRSSRSGPGLSPQQEGLSGDVMGALSRLGGPSGTGGGVTGPAGNGAGVQSTKRVSDMLNIRDTLILCSPRVWTTYVSQSLIPMLIGLQDRPCRKLSMHLNLRMALRSATVAKRSEMSLRVRMTTATSVRKQISSWVSNASHCSKKLIVLALDPGRVGPKIWVPRGKLSAKWTYCSRSTQMCPTILNSCRTSS